MEENYYSDMLEELAFGSNPIDLHFRNENYYVYDHNLFMAILSGKFIEITDQKYI